MPIALDELFELLMELCKIKELKATTYNSFKGGLVTGAATVLGGLLLGKHGLMLGAAVGTATSMALTENFKPVWMVLRDLSYNDKRKLSDNLSKALSNVGVQDLVLLSTLLLQHGSLQNIVIKEISAYLQNKYNLKIS